jgi:hypothetical protein
MSIAHEHVYNVDKWLPLRRFGSVTLHVGTMSSLKYLKCRIWVCHVCGQMCTCSCMCALQISFFKFNRTEYIFKYVKIIYNCPVLKGSCEKCLRLMSLFSDCLVLRNVHNNISFFVHRTQFHACMYILNVVHPVVFCNSSIPKKNTF